MAEQVVHVPRKLFNTRRVEEVSGMVVVLHLSMDFVFLHDQAIEDRLQLVRHFGRICVDDELRIFRPFNVPRYRVEILTTFFCKCVRGEVKVVHGLDCHGAECVCPVLRLDSILVIFPHIPLRVCGSGILHL